MADQVGDIYVDLRADITGFRSDMNRAGDYVRDWTRSTERRFETMSGTVQGIFRRVTSAAGIFGVSLGVAGVVQFARRMLEAGGGLEELSQQLGISTDMLQAMQYGATQTGVTAQEMEAGVRKLTQTMGDAAAGGRTAIAAFDAVDVKLLDSAGNLRPVDDVLRDVAEGLSRIENPALRASRAVDLMGRGGQRLLPLLSTGAAGIDAITEAAREAGVVLDRDMIKRMDDASDSISAQIFLVEKWAQVWIAENLPAIRKEIEATIREIREMGSTIQAIFDVVARGPRNTEGALLRDLHIREMAGHAEAASNEIAIAMSRVDEAVASLADAQARLGVAMSDKRPAMEIEDATERVEILTDRLVALQERVEELNGAQIVLDIVPRGLDPMEDLLYRRAQYPDQTRTTGAGQPGEADTGAADRVSGVIRALQLELDNLGRSNREKEIYNSLSRAQVAITTEAGQRIAEMAGYLYDEARARRAVAEMAQLHADQAAEADQDRADAHERAKRIIDDMVAGAAGAAREYAERQRLIDALGMSARAYEVEARYQEIANDARAAGLPLLGAEIEAARRRAEADVAQAQDMQTMQNRVILFRDTSVEALDDVSNFMRDIWRSGSLAAESFEDVTLRVLDNLYNALWELSVTNPLKNLFFGGDAGGGGLLPVIGDVIGQLFGSSSGPSGPMDHRARGGDVRAGRLYEINERSGREMFAPGVDGAVLPGDFAQGGGMNVQIIDNRGRGAPVEVSRERGPDGRDQLRVLVRDEMRVAVAEGALDRPMQSSFGLRRRGRPS